MLEIILLNIQQMTQDYVELSLTEEWYIKNIAYKTWNGLICTYLLVSLFV